MVATIKSIAAIAEIKETDRRLPQETWLLRQPRVPGEGDKIQPFKKALSE